MQYITVEVVGDFTREESLEITQAAFALGAKLGIRCYLTDVTRARNVEPVAQNVRFTMGDNPKLEFRDPDAVTALLVDPADHSHDFYVAFAQSQGIRITLFWDRDEAIQLLLEAAPQLHGSSSPDIGDTA
jgi:hypothetical protein